jgi:hypothetical protein
LNLITTGMFYDLAIRDIEMAVGAFTLARLTEARSIAEASGPQSETERPARSGVAA